MPRIRTVKPDFWQDETIGSLSHGARLLAIACLNFADDKGRFKATPLRLKVFAFAYDAEISAETVEKYLRELTDTQFLIEYSLNDETAYQVRTFLKHQQIQHPSKSKVPPPPRESLNEASLTVHDGFNEHSMGKGKEGKGKEGKGKEGSEGGGIGANGSRKARPSHPRTSLITPEWIEALKGEQTYAGLDVDRELGKMRQWCLANGKGESRRRFVNWLNRAEWTPKPEAPRDEPIPEYLRRELPRPPKEPVA